MIRINDTIKRPDGSTINIKYYEISRWKGYLNGNYDLPNITVPTLDIAAGKDQHPQPDASEYMRDHFPMPN